MVSAVISDFDLQENSAYHAARQTLDALKENAADQEESGFDASGTGAQNVSTSDGGSPERAMSCPESRETPSSGTDLTSLGNSVKSVQIRNPSETTDSDQGAAFSSSLLVSGTEDEKTKIAMLKEMFPGAKDFAIAYTLKKCDGRLDRAMDELLNQAFFAESEVADADEMIVAKGIDAFSEDNVRRRGRKKGAQKRLKSADMQEEKRASSLPATQTPAENMWTRSRHEIEFIGSRVKVPSRTVSALFHQNGASLPKTILALADSRTFRRTEDNASDEQDPVTAVNAMELGSAFPSITPSHCTALIELTHPSTTAAHELAKVLDTYSRSGATRGSPGGMDANAHQAVSEDSAKLRDRPTPIDRNSRSAWRSVIRNGTTTANAPPLSQDSTVSHPATLAHTYSLAQSRAQAQASAAARRGRSDRLMMSAAGYYSQLGRDYAAKRTEATADAADALVHSQSTCDMIDLHGVGVKDGVRIARAMIETWWKSKDKRAMGLDGRVRMENEGGVVDSLKIVTGVGKHSRGGQAMLGPAIGRMLANEGWSASVDGGVWNVTGRRR